MKPRISLLTLAMFTSLSSAPAVTASTVVFSTNFESGLPAEFSAPGSAIAGVAGYAGLGPPGRQFGGQFLRYASVPIHPTTLTVRNLPPHDHLSVKFLLGLIDSWDGTELMQIKVDGVMKFNYWFELARGDSSNYEPPPPGALLSSGTSLGFTYGTYHNRDRAYDLGVEPAFLDIPHIADSVQVVWTLDAVSGSAASQWQGEGDESWAIDAVSVEVSTQNVSVAPDRAAGALGLAAWPNPTRGRSMRFDLALPTAAPARLELLDLAGRRVAVRELSDLAPGWHSVTMEFDRTLVAGIYFARLSQGARVRAARVAVTD